MADEVDNSNEKQDLLLSKRIAYLSAKSVLEKGVEGDCDKCAEYSLRLIKGVCAPCRDKWKLP